MIDTAGSGLGLCRPREYGGRRDRQASTTDRAAPGPHKKAERIILQVHGARVNFSGRHRFRDEILSPFGSRELASHGVHALHPDVVLLGEWQQIAQPQRG